MERFSFSNKPCGDCVYEPTNQRESGKLTWAIDVKVWVRVTLPRKRGRKEIPKLKPAFRKRGEAVCLFLCVDVSKVACLITLTPNLNTTLSTPVDAWSILN